MARIRILAFVAFLVSLGATAWGISSHPYETRSAWNFAATMATISGPFCLASSIVVGLLSFFAIQANADGSFVIRSSSLYGRVFLYLNRFSDKDDDHNFCQVFWKTTLTVMMGFLMAAFVGVFGFIITMMWINGVDLTMPHIPGWSYLLGVWALFLGALFFLLYSDIHSLSLRRMMLVAVALLAVLFAALAVTKIVIDGEHLTPYLLTKMALMVFGGLTLLMIASAVLGALLEVAGRAVQFLMERFFAGTQFEYFYKQYLCPRIVIKKSS